MSENFLTYIETDPNSRFTVESSKVTVTGLRQNEDAYVYKDKGAAYFAADFTLLFTLYIDSTVNGTRGHFVALTNIINDLWGIDTASGDYLTLRIENTTGTETFRLQECDGGTTYESGVISLSEDTIYYCKITRVESVGTYGTLYLSVYSDAARTTQVGSTQSIALHTSKKDFQYIFPVVSFNNSVAYTISGYVEELDITLAVTPVITQQSLTDIAPTTVTANGTIVSEGNSAVTAHGAVWDTSTINTATAPTAQPNYTDEGAGVLGAFTTELTSLTPGTTYYIRLYATNASGSSYSAEIEYVAGSETSQKLPRSLFWVGNELHAISPDGIEYTVTLT
jgi:hypothetical protein